MSQYLNTAFNPWNIFFVGWNTGCTPPFDTTLTAIPADPNIDDEALFIYDLGDVDSIVGDSYGIPSTYLSIKGTNASDPGGRSAVLIHEMGHCLGLIHTYAGNGNAESCNENAQPYQCFPGTDPFIPPCHCCGDAVCDTDPNIVSNINAGSACSNPQPFHPQFDNYMSGTLPHSCKNKFTPEQAQRMHQNLREAPVLQGIKLDPTSIPGGTIGAVSGNIVLDANSGITSISSPLAMLSGATITVKPGATLNVTSTITSACDGMWGGVIVEGVSNLPQNTANQGRLRVTSGGKIEHATCGATIGRVDANGDFLAGHGGGIVTVSLGGEFLNNTIGIRFGEYSSQPFLAHRINNGKFNVDDNYRGGSGRVTHVELNGNIGIRIDNNSEFKDQRGSCSGPYSRAIGINAYNSGALITNCRFEGLQKGIYGDQLTAAKGSLNISVNRFYGCYKEVEIVQSGGFRIAGNNFYVGKPAGCPSVAGYPVYGAQITGNSPGFIFRDNSFDIYAQNADETLIGSECAATGKGLRNTIFRNSYANMVIGNRALGSNGGGTSGLLYLCNTHEFSSINSTIQNPYNYYVSGSIRNPQNDIDANQAILPTGNVFSHDGFSYPFYNVSGSIEYYYNPAEDSMTNIQLENPVPGVSWLLDAVGITAKDVNDPNLNCLIAEPCNPCTEFITDVWKDEFWDDKQDWLEKRDSLPFISDPVKLETIEKAIASLRWEMDVNAGKILTNYSQDTTEIQTDSILAWLENAETYGTDLYLAKHYFFSGQYNAFDSLWAQIPGKYELDETTESEFQELELVYATIRPHLDEGDNLYRLPSEITDSLWYWADWCNDPGFLANIVLRRNGRYIETDCPGDGIGERSMDRHEKTTTIDHTPTLKIYPNPAKEYLIVESLKGIEDGNISIFNAQGKQVTKHILPDSATLFKLPTSYLTPGIYILEISFSGTLTEHHKIFISR